MTDQAGDSQQPLSEDESALLREACREGSHSGDGLRLAGRDASTLDLRRLSLRRGAFEDVHLRSSDLSECRVVETSFERVNFEDTSLDDGRFQDVTFSACEFARPSMKAAFFKNVTLTACRFETIRMDTAGFQGCVFDGLDDKATRFENTVLDDCVFRNCRLAGSTFFGARLTGVRFEECTLDGVVFSDVEGTEVVFEGGRVDLSGFDRCQFKALRFRDTAVENLSLTDCRLSEFAFEHPTNLFNLSVFQTEMDRLIFVDAGTCSVVEVSKSEAAEWLLKGSTVTALEWVDSKLSESGQITSCTLNGVNFSGSTLVGLDVTGSTFTGHVKLANASFTGLAASGNSRDPGLTVDSDGVTYDGAVRLP